MAMRITNGMMIGNFVRNLNSNGLTMNKYQMQIAANKRVLRLSDDPVGITKILTARSRIADMEQNESNIRDANTWLAATETALQDINRSTARMYELSVDLANETKTASDRQAAANEIAQIRDHILSALNSSVSGHFLFGGYNVTTAPYSLVDRVQDGASVDADGYALDEFGRLVYEQKDIYDAFGNYLHTEDDPTKARKDLWYNRVVYGGALKAGFMVDHPDFAITDPSDPNYNTALWDEYNVQAEQQIRFPFGPAVDIPVATMGLRVTGIGSNNLYRVYEDFYQAMKQPEMADFETAQKFIGEFQRLQDTTLSAMGDIGGRVNRLEMMTERYAIDKENYTKMLDDIEGLDLAEAITNLSFAEATYRATLGVGGRILQPTLLDFLR